MTSQNPPVLSSSVASSPLRSGMVEQRISLSTGVELAYVAQGPDDGVPLVLEGAIGALAAIPDSEAFAAMIASLTDPLDPAIVREFQLSTITQPVAPEHVDRFVQESLKVPAHVWHSVIAALMGDDTYQRISAIRAPTVLLWGDQDGVGTRDAQEALVAGIANARLIVYAGTGHAVHWEQPERAAADISAFIDSLASTSHGGATA